LCLLFVCRAFLLSSNINGRYQLGLDDGGAHNITYQQYNPSRSLIKTVVGKWTLQDEGVYGPAMTLTLSFTGKNAGLPFMKFIAQYDGFGNLQGVIDNQRTMYHFLLNPLGYLKIVIECCCYLYN